MKKKEENRHAGYYLSPVGLLGITASHGGITELKFLKGKKAGASDPLPLLRECCRQLDEYFQGKRMKFDLKLSLQGTEFQKLVWSELRKIPLGKTASYKEIAGVIGRPQAWRAVGAANRRNKIAVVIPCHRVIGSDGSLTGFGGGLWRKKRLLDHERDIACGKK